MPRGNNPRRTGVTYDADGQPSSEAPAGWGSSETHHGPADAPAADTALTRSTVAEKLEERMMA